MSDGRTLIRCAPARPDAVEGHAALRVYAAPIVFLGRPDSPGAAARFLREGAVALEGDRITAVGDRASVEARHGRAEWLDAIILPALVNAHTHLELSHLRGRVPGGEGLPSWIHRLIATRAADVAAGPGADGQARSIADAITELERFGVAAVGEVTNTLAALSHLTRAGMAGTIFHEVFGFSERRIAAAMTEADAMLARAEAPGPALAIARSPHAVYSTRPGVVRELLRAGPASIHLAEDPSERLFCNSASGPFALLNTALGTTDLVPLGRSPVAAVADHLGPRSLAVHAVDVDDDDLADLARSRATVALCPRSNLHIGGRVADLRRLMEAGIPLAVGTDSLASSPSLSPLAELAALARAYPTVDPARLLPLSWHGAAVGAPAVGRLAAGAAPGVLAAPIDAAGASDPAAWLVEEFGRGERPFRWLARHRPEVAA